MATEITLKNHQIKPIEFMKKNDGLLLYHSTGSGKTLTALFAMAQFDYPIIIIGTKSSKKTFVDNIKKAALDENRFTFFTYTKIKKILEYNITFFKNHSVIVDEAHTIRNENMYNLYIASALVAAKKLILLTATPVVNYLNDLSVLINVVKREDVLPTDHKLFDQMFYDEEESRLINTDILLSKLKNTISYYEIANDENYPTRKIHIVEVEMNHAQIDEYAYYLRKIFYEGDNLVDTNDMLNISYGMMPSKKRNFFLNVTRQLSNTVKNSPDTPKIKAIFEKIKEGPYPIIVYSNFLKNGIYTLAILLEKHSIPYKTITGFTSNDRINIIVNNYNQGQYKILLISSAGSESLDFKNTRQIHIMEPHWNQAKPEQIYGRTIRYLSHYNLPKEERHVDIYLWISKFPERIKNLSADQYLLQLSKKKKDVWNKFQKIIIDASIEKNYF